MKKWHWRIFFQWHHSFQTFQVNHFMVSLWCMETKSWWKCLKWIYEDDLEMGAWNGVHIFNLLPHCMARIQAGLKLQLCLLGWVLKGLLWRVNLWLPSTGHLLTKTSISLVDLVEEIRGIEDKNLRQSLKVLNVTSHNHKAAGLQSSLSKTIH